MATLNACRKGKRGERAWRDALRSFGFEARRGRQFSGSPDSPDVVCPSLPGYHFEVKAVEKLNLHEAYAQALRDAGSKVAVVAHKRNHGAWMVTMAANDWLTLMRSVFIAVQPVVKISTP
jgi:Holliday junction resolvase